MRDHTRTGRRSTAWPLVLLVWLAATSAHAEGAAVYGAGLRARWVSVPGWALSLATKQNEPLSSYGFGGELFRRKDGRDIAFGLTYQRMSPPDGNWLARGHDASLDTDLVQFRDFAIIGFDVSVIWRLPVREHVAFRYGGGLGLALIQGQVLRVSAAGCTEQNAGDTRACRPRYCPAQGPCPESLHVMNEGRVDNGPADPHRYPDRNVPGAFPVLNLLAGFDFQVPQVKGLELRVEGGFYDAFFLGAGGVYLF
jgi:hypothetical protein